MSEEILRWIKIIIIVVLSFFVIKEGKEYYDKHKQDGIKVEQNVDLKPVIDNNIKKHIPTGAKVYGQIENKVDNSDPSRKTKITTVVHSDPKCLTCNPKVTQVTETKIKYGLTSEFKLYAGYTDSNLTIGLGYSFLRFNKVTTDLLLSMPYAGIGVGYQLTNNIFVGGGANLKYLNFKTINDFSSYNLNLANGILVLPVAFAGVRF